MDIQGFQEEVVKAILFEAKQQGRDSLTRTMLMKLVYLLDVFVAEDSHGSPFTQYEWRFHHFGPYAHAAQDCFDNLAKKGFLQTQQRFSQESGSKYVLYQLCEYGAKVTSLKEFGVPVHARNKLRTIIKKKADSLPNMLDYIYFETAPMKAAHPGDVLDFSACEKVDMEAYRMNPIPIQKSNLDRAKELLASMSESRSRVAERKAALLANQGPFDDVFNEGMNHLDGEGLSTGLKGTASILKVM